MPIQAGDTKLRVPQTFRVQQVGGTPGIVASSGYSVKQLLKSVGLEVGYLPSSLQHL